MNPKKRKADDDDEEIKLETKQEKVGENEKKDDETADIILSENCDSGCGGNSTDPLKADIGGSSLQPGSSELNLPNDCDNANSSTASEKQTRLERDGSNIAGTLLFCGGTNWDLVGRKELPKNAKNAVGVNLWSPHRIASLQGIRVTSVHAGCCAVHSCIIAEGGTPYTWGRNDKSQLGLGDTKRRDIPTIVDTLKNHSIISAACGRSHTLFLSDKGIVYSAGDNKFGQCGLGTQNNTISIPSKIPFKGRSITKVACGAEFSCIIDIRGGLYSFGCPEYGQLGHNSDGRYFVTSNKLSFRCELVPRRVIAFIEKTREGHVTLVDDVEIVTVACGINHTVAIDTKKRCYSYGFGGYGRLGHAQQKDELVPRLIKTFDGPNRGVKRVYAGGTFSLAVNEFDVLYFFGQNKRAGEATMYPKAIPELMGWSVREAACANCSIVCLADQSVISWGPSPTWGELGYGANKPKSSTTPQEVKCLDGLHIHTIACGYGHTLFIARDDEEGDKEKLNQLPEYTP